MISNILQMDNKSRVYKISNNESSPTGIRPTRNSTNQGPPKGTNPESNLYFVLKQILRKNPEKFTHHNDTLALERGGKSPTRVGLSNYDSQVASWCVVDGRIPQLK